MVASAGKLNVHSSANQERTPMTAKPTSGVIISGRRIVDCKCEAVPTEVAGPDTVTIHGDPSELMILNINLAPRKAAGSSNTAWRRGANQVFHE